MNLGFKGSAFIRNGKKSESKKTVPLAWHSRSNIAVFIYASFARRISTVVSKLKEQDKKLPLESATEVIHTTSQAMDKGTGREGKQGTGTHHQEQRLIPLLWRMLRWLGRHLRVYNLYHQRLISTVTRRSQGL